LSTSTLPVAREARVSSITQHVTRLRLSALAVSAGLTAVSAVLWIVSLRSIDAAQANGLGLLSVVGPLYLASVVGLCVAFAIAVTRSRPAIWLCLAQVITLVVVLNTLAAIVEAEPGYFSAYLHAGFTNYIADNGATLPLVDARFNWPGSFSLAALLSETMGLHDGVLLIRWAPLFFELLYLLPLWVIASAATNDARARWVSVWLFYLANWVGQDYLSPQGLNFFFFLVVVAGVLHWFRAPDRRRVWQRGTGRLRRLVDLIGSDSGVDGDVAVPRVDALRRSAILLTLLVVAAVIVVSHQLTPVLLIVVLGALAISRRITTPRLPVLIAVMFFGYLSLGAKDFWMGHLNLLTAGLGNLNHNVNANLGSRINGSTLHHVVLAIRISLAATMLGLAAIGVVRRWRAGSRKLAWATAAIAPLSLVALQSYGGEALLRSYLFSLPFLCILAAGALLPVARPVRAQVAVATAVIGALLAVGFVGARYGNEQFQQVAPSELHAVQWVYAHAPHGSTLIAASRNLPWRFRDLHGYRYLPSDDAIVSTADTVIGLLESGTPSFFISTRSQGLFGQEMYGLKAGWLQDLDAELERSDRVTILFAEGDARVYALDGTLGARP
jgi:hypothetical protein